MMFQMKRSTVFTAMTVFALTGGAGADPNPPENNLQSRLTELEQRDVQNSEMINALRAEVNALRNGQDDSWLTEQRSEEIRSLVHDVLADADTRASMLGSNMGAGWDKGFYLGSDDGNFMMRISGGIQVRATWNNQDLPTVDTDENRFGFENKRTTLKFKGHVVDPSWGYFIHAIFNNGGTFVPLDIVISKDLGDGWSVKGGKFKLPFLREQLMAYTRLQPVERTLVSSTWGVGRSEGIAIQYKDDQFKFNAAYSDGLGSIGGTSSSALTLDTEYAFTARVEWLAQGNWGQFNDFSSAADDETGWLVGAAIHLETGEFGEDTVNDGTPPETDIMRWTVDVSAEFGGYNFFAAVVGHSTDTPTGTGDVDQLGIVVQGGMFLNDDWEVFARYEWGDEDSADPAVDELSVLTVGAVRYFSGHQIQWTTDVGIGLNEVRSTFASAGAGYRTDGTGQDGQLVLRSQFQLTF